MTLKRAEFGYILRFACAGLLNAATGLGSIFILMRLGTSPLWANVAGYAISLSIAFFTARLFVFRSTGKTKREGTRYLISFSLAFSANLVVLQICLLWLHLHQDLSQALATVTYVVTMYILSRVFVFNRDT